jgi:hypothetical protein
MDDQPKIPSWKTYRDKLRYEVFSKLCGGKPRCMCPGCTVTFIGFLSLDHVNGGGSAHRLTEGLGTGSSRLWAWVRDNGYPVGMYQVLCHNCNKAKFNKPQCPLHGLPHC